MKVISLIAEIRGRANSFIVSKMNSLGMKGLVTSHGNILGLLYQKGPCRMADIARQINRKKNTVTTLINKLVNQGYVNIIPDENDNRVKIVELSEKGLGMKEDFFLISDELIELTFKDFEEDRKNEIIEYLEKIKSNLG